MKNIWMQELWFIYLRPTAHPPSRRVSFLHGPSFILYELRAELETAFRPGEAKTVSTGLIITGPPGIRYQIVPRSGLIQERGLRFGGGHPYCASHGLEILLSNVRTELAILPAGEHIADLIYKPRGRPLSLGPDRGGRAVWKIIDADRP